MKLFVYDPGQTTGWASFDVHPNTKTARLVAYGEHDLWRGIAGQIASSDDVVVVYENIVPRHPSFNPIGLQVIGAIRLLSEIAEVTCEYQTNAQIHGVFKWRTYDKLFEKIPSPHSKDAIAHGIVYLRRNGYALDFDSTIRYN